MTEERILAIDFGEKRIGLALCDPLRIFAYPFKTILNDNDLWGNLKNIISENHVVEIVLGYPLKESGEKSSSTLMVEKFRDELAARSSLPVILRDERYSSSIAMEKILQSTPGKKKRRDKGLVDRNAASVILQEYLDELSGRH